MRRSDTAPGQAGDLLRDHAGHRRPASDCRDLLALPASARSVVDAGRFGGLTACDTRRAVYGTERRAILTHSSELHAPPGPRL